MSQTPNSKLIENEVIFARINQALKRRVARLTQNVADDLPLAFYCECSNEDCRERITIEPNEYDDIHTDRRAFVIVKGHEVAEVEDIAEERDGFCVVIKRQPATLMTDGKLNPTDL